MPHPTFGAVKDEYTGLWHACQIKPEHKSEVMATARRIIMNRPRYDEISRLTGVPWFVIGIIHSLECGLDFNKHLHNGDSLKKRTWQVPANRPPVWPPKNQDTFVASAVDALTMPGKEFHKITDWGVERIAYALEIYNGWGYRLYRKIHSPYLWSFTNGYTSGKYVRDGVWSAAAVSSQCGGMAILKALLEIDPHMIDGDLPEPVPAWPKADPTVPATTAVAVVKVAGTSRSVWALLVSALLWVLSKVRDAVDWIFDIVPGVTADVEQQVGAIQAFAKLLQVNWVEITSSAALVLTGIAIWRHVSDKKELVERRDADPT